MTDSWTLRVQLAPDSDLACFSFGQLKLSPISVNYDPPPDDEELREGE